MLNTQDYKAQILDEMACRFEANHNSLADAYALIWAIDVYASLVWFETGKKGKECKFKDAIQAQCEEFGIIRSASNAIKHIERGDKDVVVYSMGDIRAGSGPSFHSWFANGGNSEPSVAITMNWEHDPDTNEFRDGAGKIMVAPESHWKTQYLRRLYRPAIEAIEAKLKELQKVCPT
ncbi:hypothetical protein RNZ50_08970 [Paracoccaceae bacterium Fryx2]|nr:hypothetical protein [Paracoccaceae bacterium Fryx2]